MTPTLLALTGQPARPDLDGHSLVPQLRDARAPREWPAITTHNPDNHGVRSERWRYIRYADGGEERAAEPEPHDGLRLGPAAQLEVMVERAHPEQPPAAGQRAVLREAQLRQIPLAAERLAPGQDRREQGGARQDRFPLCLRICSSCGSPCRSRRQVPNRGHDQTAGQENQ